MSRGLRTALLISLATLGRAAVARGQQAEADSAWSAGDFVTARINYERVLQADPGSARANYRLGILLSWDGKLDSALVLIRRAHQADPGDPGIQLTEAQVLGWAERYDLADSVYREVLARDPDNQEAAVGRAQLLAWQGDLDAAVDAYLAILAHHDDNIQAVLGLGQVYLWQDKLDLARQQSARATRLDPANKTAWGLANSVSGARRPEPELTLGWSHDSDHNTNWWQTIAASLLLADGLRGFGSAGALEATDPIRKSTRLGAEAGVILGISDWYLTAALGIRQLFPGGAPNRTAGTYRAAAAWRINRSAGANISYSHAPFDETALLMARHLDLDALDVGLDIKLKPGLQLGAGAGHAWLSDSNFRNSGVLALTKTLRPNLTAGLFTRIMGYDFPGVGYFSPNRLLVFEGRGAYGFTRAPWHGRLSGGLGIQQVGTSGSAQVKGHVEGKVGRNWSGENTVDLFAGFSTSAESST
ncbi:MAG TPA: tetratricopeptide repeat protein, partial [Gemmatimonadales bacterium]|nr:tetratricopeptide repeat protein [Gemmatimonadales bacterium]